MQRTNKDKSLKILVNITSKYEHYFKVTVAYIKIPQSIFLKYVEKIWQSLSSWYRGLHGEGPWQPPNLSV
jgi:hypothetical protein